MALSRASSLQKQRGRPVRTLRFPLSVPGGLLFCMVRYIIPLTSEVQANLCSDHYRYPGFPMTHLDLIQAQRFVRQQSNWPAKKLRRQLMGAAVFLLIGGGYAVWHASAKPSAPAAPPPA